MAIVTTTVSEEDDLITLDDAKDSLRVIHDDEDSLIELLIKAARGRAETYSRRALVAKTMEARLSCFPRGRRLELEQPPLREVTSIEYVDTNGDTQTLSEDLYTVDTHATPGAIVLNQYEQWPLTNGNPGDVIVTYEAGYSLPTSDTAGDFALRLPGEIDAAIKFLVNHWYHTRTAVLTGPMANVASVPETFVDILLPWAVPL
jgi:uncharacterized phiE125 gp8 family phage protein